MAKVMVSIPDDLLERIDHEAERRGTSRSALLQEAARRELRHLDPEQLDRRLAEVRAALAGGPAFDSGEAVREERDQRDARDRRRL